MDGDTPVHLLVEQHDPNSVAVVGEGASLTYGELNAAADRIAGVLLADGLEGHDRGRLVVLCVGDTVAAIMAALGVLKAGGVYVYLDPAHDQSLARIITECDPFAVLTDGASGARAKAAAGSRRVIEIDGLLAGPPVGTPRLPIGGDDLATVLSPPAGGADVPTGVVLDHHNLAAAHHSWQVVQPLRPGDRYLRTGLHDPAEFTAAWVRAFGAGSTLIVPPDRALDLDVLRGAQATVLAIDVGTAGWLTGLLRSHPGTLDGVRLISVGGDRWYLDQQWELASLAGASARHISAYGVREAIADSTYFDPSLLPWPVDNPEQVCLVGAAYPGVGVRILGDDGQPVPTGQIGEVCLAGPTVGRGYWRRPDLTSARFREVHGDVVFRTGDLGRFRDGGLLEFVARTDWQPEKDDLDPLDVARVEAVLRSHPLVRESLVHRGTAYVAPAAVDPTLLRDFVAAQVPEELVPDAVVALDALPRTREGRADRRHLPAPSKRAARRPAPVAAPAPPAVVESTTQTAPVVPPVVAAPSPAFATAPPAAPAAQPVSGWLGWTLATLIFGGLAYWLAGIFWSGSTDVSIVPQPEATAFRALYVLEDLAFGLGVAVLFLAGPLLARAGAPGARGVVARLALAWLLAGWWPRDNIDRLTTTTDWARITVVYAFDASLMVAAAVLVAALAGARRTPL
jgi:acyl-CoA synthetase (AMP-forming)/AMP-acid ligase II